MHNFAFTIKNGLTGMIASIGSVTMTFAQDLEIWVRLAGSCLGLVIAFLTLCNLIRGRGKQ